MYKAFLYRQRHPKLKVLRGLNTLAVEAPVSFPYEDLSTERLSRFIFVEPKIIVILSNKNEREPFKCISSHYEH